MGIFGNQFDENDPGRHLVISTLIGIVRHVYNNNQGYIKIKSLVLRSFSTIFNEIERDSNIILGG